MLLCEAIAKYLLLLPLLRLVVLCCECNPIIVECNKYLRIGSTFSMSHCNCRANALKQMLPHGLEPWTSRLLAERSNQLSYESGCTRNPHIARTANMKFHIFTSICSAGERCNCSCSTQLSKCVTNYRHIISIIQQIGKQFCFRSDSSPLHRTRGLHLKHIGCRHFMHNA